MSVRADSDEGANEDRDLVCQSSGNSNHCFANIRSPGMESIANEVVARQHDQRSHRKLDQVDGVEGDDNPILELEHQGQPGAMATSDATPPRPAEAKGDTDSIHYLEHNPHTETSYHSSRLFVILSMVDPVLGRKERAVASGRANSIRTKIRSMSYLKTQRYY